MTSNKSKRMNGLRKRGLCLAGVCSILLSLAATGCDAVSAVSAAAGVEKADQRSLPCSILCPPHVRSPSPFNPEGP
jgi:hypothetical protein